MNENRTTLEEMQIVCYKKLGVIESNRQIVINESKGRLKKQEPGQIYDVPKPLASKEPPRLNMEEQDNVFDSILEDITTVATFAISLLKSLKIK